MVLSYLCFILLCGKIIFLKDCHTYIFSIGVALAQHDRIHTDAERMRILVGMIKYFQI